MFQRVIHADWVSIVPPIAFACFVIAFGLVIFRALSLPKKEIERIARLPLDETGGAPPRQAGPPETSEKKPYLPPAS